MAGAGKRDTVRVKQKIAKCMVIGESMLRNVRVEHAAIMVECFPGIKTEHVHRLIEKKNLGSPETVIFHVGTNDLGVRILDFVIEVYALVATARNKLPLHDEYCNKIKNAIIRDVSALVYKVQAIPSSISSRRLTMTGLFAKAFLHLLRRED
jgi:hypothetical protein